MTLPQALPSLIAAVAAIACGWMVYKNSRRANAATMSQTQLQWTQQAMTQAKAAETKAVEAEDKAERATKQARHAQELADEAGAQARRMTTQMHDVMDWVDRVVRYAGDARNGPDPISDPRMIRLLAIINGGPPGSSNPNIRRPE